MENNSKLDEESLKIKLKWENMKSNGYKSHLIIKNIPPKGLGVFANRDFSEGEEIEYCHMIPMAFKRRYIHDPGIIKYAYWSSCQCDDCKKHGQSGFILLGNGSIYNSANSEKELNATFRIYTDFQVTVFKATKKIKKDEEILVWWGQRYYDTWCSQKEQ